MWQQKTLTASGEDSHTSKPDAFLFYNMLNNNEYGYAVMSKSLDAYVLEDTRLETCKKYCRNGDVIVKRIPYVAGFSIKFVWHKYIKPIEFKRRYRYGNIFKLHFYWNREYLHKIGEIVYKS